MELERRLLVLKLVLDNLGVGNQIQSVDDRKRVQKAIYLAQVASRDLGYRFGWYLMGPYSPELTRDYYALADIPDDDIPQDKRLKVEFRDRLASLRALLDVPGDIDLPQPDWLELLASVHYLRRVTRLDREAARARLESAKPHLVQYYDQASATLREGNLLG
jgi:hypothetical protein